jgi:hypothetical protein
MPLLFITERVNTMGRKSRYQGYMKAVKKMEEKKVKGSTPRSILAKLKELKGQNAVLTVPVGETNE